MELALGMELARGMELALVRELHSQQQPLPPGALAPSPKLTPIFCSFSPPASIIGVIWVTMFSAETYHLLRHIL
jgi:hypothetical protein